VLFITHQERDIVLSSRIPWAGQAGTDPEGKSHRVSDSGGDKEAPPRTFLPGLIPLLMKMMFFLLSCISVEQRNEDFVPFSIGAMIKAWPYPPRDLVRMTTATTTTTTTTTTPQTPPYTSPRRTSRFCKPHQSLLLFFLLSLLGFITATTTSPPDTITTTTTTTTSTTSSLLTRAIELHLSGDSKESSRLYMEILSLEPHHVMALNNLAALHHAAGDHHQVVVVVVVEVVVVVVVVVAVIVVAVVVVVVIEWLYIP